MGKIEIYQDLRRIFPKPMDRAYTLSKEHRTVNDIMTMEVQTITSNLFMKDAAIRMGEMRIGSLVVIEGREPAGIVTERDLLTNIIAEGEDPARVRIGDAMSSPLVTVEGGASIKSAAQTMEERRKTRLVVIEGGQMVGIITSSDLIKSMPEVPQTLRTVDAFMTPRVVTVDAETTALDAAGIMGKERIGSVITTLEGDPYGIFTERDLLTKFYAEDRPLDSSISKYCSSPIIATIPRAKVTDAAHAMASKNIRRLPIADDGELVGIVTARDLVRAYAN